MRTPAGERMQSNASTVGGFAFVLGVAVEPECRWYGTNPSFRDSILDAMVIRCRTQSTRTAWFAALLGVSAPVIFTPNARACSICACGDPLLTANDPAAITGKLRLQFDTEYLRIDAGTDERPGFTDQLAQWSYRLNAVYRPTSRLSVMATVPILDKAIHTVGGGSDELTSHLTGLGDAELGARYGVWRSIDYGVGRMQEVALAGGVAMPTGSNEARATDATGDVILVDPHGQLGTGGWGPFFGLHYRFEQADWMGFADLSYRVRTTGSYFDGSTYKFGDAALWSVHGQYRLLSSLALDVGVDGRYAQTDAATGPGQGSTSSVDNTGGTLLSAAPGVYVNAVRGLWVFARFQIPLYKNLYGEQDVKPSVAAGLQYQAL
jgi:hypothetical protein